jgi:hypothetical protein
LAATYNFANQMGTFSVINYDGRSFSATGRAASQGANYTFRINNPQGIPIAGTINGSFYGPMAAETGGNFAFNSTAARPIARRGSSPQASAAEAARSQMGQRPQK